MYREHALRVINDESRRYFSVTNFISISFDSAAVLEFSCLVYFEITI